MLLSLDKPSPAAAAAAAVLLLLEPAAGDEELVAVTGPSVEIVIVREPSVVVGAVPLAGASTRVTVKFAGFVDVAEVLGSDQVVVGVVDVQSVAWAPTWSGLGFVSCAWARKVVVVAPSAARIW